MLKIKHTLNLECVVIINVTKTSLVVVLHTFIQVFVYLTDKLIQILKFQFPYVVPVYISSTSILTTKCI